MSPTCINLRERFGDKYRVRFEESYRAERGEHGRADDPWFEIIPCKHGHICPWGGDLLAICTNQRGGIARRLMALPFVQVVQDGSDGINATFPVERFEDIAEIVKPKRRRRLTPEQRQAAVERLRNFQFSPARQSDSEELERAQSGPDDIWSTDASEERIGDVPAGVSHRDTAAETSPSELVGGRTRARARLAPVKPAT